MNDFSLAIKELHEKLSGGVITNLDLTCLSLHS